MPPRYLTVAGCDHIIYYPRSPRTRRRRAVPFAPFDLSGKVAVITGGNGGRFCR